MVNVHRYQNAIPRTMIFSPAFVVSYLSQFLILQPGDLISTGTPPGCWVGAEAAGVLEGGESEPVGSRDWR